MTGRLPANDRLPYAARATYVCPACGDEFEVVGTVEGDRFTPDDPTEAFCCHVTAELAGWTEITRADVEADMADRACHAMVEGDGNG